MSEFLTYHEIDAATDAVRDRITTTPEIALILGSGLGELADSIENPTIIPIFTRGFIFNTSLILSSLYTRVFLWI